MRCWRAGRAASAALLLALAASSAGWAGAQAQGSGTAAVPDLVIVCRSLGLDALRDASRPQLQRLARHGATALVSTPTPPPHDPITSALSLAAGRPERALPSDAWLLRPDEPIEGSTAEVVFARRTGGPGPTPDGERLLHLGIGALARRGLAADLVAAAAERGTGHPAIALLAPARPNADQRLAGLLAVNASGVCPTDRGASVPIQVIGVGVGARELEDALAREAQGRRRVWVVPSAGPAERWRLALTVLGGADAKPGLLTSNATRTRGLIAAFDIAPTMLAWLGAPRPPGMRGGPVRVVGSGNALGELAAMDRIVAANERAMTPVLLGLGLVLAVLVFPATIMLRRRPYVPALSARALPVLLATPFGLLAAPAIARATGAESVPAMSAAVATAMLAASALCTPRRTQRRTADQVCARVYGLAALAIVADTALGGRLIRMSLLSSFQLSGIRFYGIGNEFMGMLIGTALVALPLAGARTLWIAATGVLISAAIGLPTLGANGGGAVAAVAAFGMATWTASGRRATLASALIFTALGVAFAGSIGLADATLSGAAPTHLGAAVIHARGHGVGTLLEIAQRKAQMAATIATAWGVLLAVGGSAVFLLIAYWTRRTEVSAMVAQRPHWWQARYGVALGSIVALVANDSGAVPALFIFGAYFASGIYFLLWDAGHVDKQGLTSVQSSHV